MPFPSSDYPTRLQLRIDWSELDLFGHVNNVTYFKYMQAARVGYWESVGLWQHHKDTKTGPMLASATCDFRQPLFFPGNITVYSKVEFMRNTSFGMAHVIINEEGAVCAEGKDVMVMFDFNANAKMRIPQIFREAIESREGRSF